MSRPTSQRSLEAGLFLIVVALPVLFTPFSAAPFADPKLLALALGALLISHSSFAVDRNLGFIVLAWLTTLTMATALGVDPLWSLLGRPLESTGALMLGASAVLLAAAGSVKHDLRARVPLWLFWTGIVVASIAVLGRFIDFGGPGWELGSLSATIGHRVFAGGFLAAAAIATFAMPPTRASMAGSVIIGSGLAVTAVRGAWLGAAFGAAWAIWRGGVTRRAAVGILLPLILTMAAWTAADSILPEREIEFSAAPRFAQLDEGSAAERPHVWRAYLRAVADDPLLGTGTATGWYGYLSHAEPDEIRAAGRGWGSAHNIALEVAATTGLVGLLPAILLVGLISVRALRGPPSHAWAAGVAIALAAVHALQPFNIVLTPLLFLSAGLCTAPSASTVKRRTWLTVALLLVALVAIARLFASSFERYGDTYDSVAALRLATTLEPQRLSAHRELAYFLAFDPSPTEAAEARSIVRRMVADHPWHPGVRLTAADVEVLLGNLDAGAAWIDKHLEVFPNDPLALGGGAVVALRAERPDDADALARRALEIDPDQGLARGVLDALIDPGRL